MGEPFRHGYDPTMDEPSVYDPPEEPITVFNRFEKKYLMPEEVYFELRHRLKPYMQVDMYGLTQILNIYFDTPDDLLVRRSNEFPVYKEKLRLRSYGVPKMDSLVFLEIKKKHEGLVNKRRVGMKLHEAYDYVERGIRPEGERPPAEEQILREIDFFIQRYDLHPAMNVNYQRVALFARDDPEYRVTFDHFIRGRRTDVGLEKGAYGVKLIPDNYYLMETKILDATPYWFTKILSDLSLYMTTFSKYGNLFRQEHDAFDAEAYLRHRLDNWNKTGEKSNV